MGEIIFLLCFAVISLIMFYLTGDFRVSKMDTSGGAALFPRIVIVILLVFLAIRVIEILRSKEKKKFSGRELFTGSRLYFITGFVLYVVLLKPLGYIIATSLFLVFTVNRFYQIENGTLGTMVQIVVRNMIMIFFVLAMNWAFGTILSVMLPTGPLPT